jgi:hypothetical protein
VQICLSVPKLLPNIQTLALVCHQQKKKTAQSKLSQHHSKILTLSNPIFLPLAYSPALIYFGQERGWWITCNYPSFKREKQKQKEYNLHYLLAKVCTT